MANKILDQLTDQDIFGLIYLTTNGEICSDNQDCSLTRGDVYSVKINPPKMLSGLMFLPSKNFEIKFTDTEIKEYKGKQNLISINSAYKKYMKEILENNKDLTM